MGKFEDDAGLVANAIRLVETRFGQVFGLKAFPGKRFRIFDSDCFVSEGRVLLYTSIETETGGWSGFCKGTEPEVFDQAVKL